MAVSVVGVFLTEKSVTGARVWRGEVESMLIEVGVADCGGEETGIRVVVGN